MTSFILRQAHARPAEVGLRDERAALCWSEVSDLVNRIAWLFHDLKLKPAARIAVIAENCAEILLTHVGALLAGISVVPVNHHLRVEEAAHLLLSGEVEAVLTGPESVEMAAKAASLAGVQHVLGWRCNDKAGLRSFDAALAAETRSAFDVLKAPRPPLLFTSGTTGVPKAIELPQAMFPRTPTLDAHLEELARTDALAGIGPHLVIGPLYHTGPLGASRLLSLGTSVVVLRKFDAGRTLQAITENKIASIVCVPTHFVRLLALPDEVKRSYDMSSLRFVGHTGAPCPVKVKRAMIEWWGPKLFESYGATEVGGVARISSEEWLKFPGSVGRARERYTFLIVDERGTPLPVGQEGRVYFIDRLGIGIEYRNDPQKTAAAHLRPGVFTLGEVGYVNEEGYLFLTDRFSDTVISGGVNIYPAEAEKVLAEHPKVLDVACRSSARSCTL
jgi:acyl-CoA synthetase (AMP-forming)/AMP-acid ligase II